MAFEFAAPLRRAIVNFAFRFVSFARRASNAGALRMRSSERAREGARLPMTKPNQYVIPPDEGVQILS